MTSLGSLLDAAGVDAALGDAQRALRVTTVELDSRRCVPGSVFVCMTGTTTTGTAFVADAVARGAICVVGPTPSPEAPVSVTVAESAMRGTLAALSSAVVGNPASQLRLVGVTGTNGKTTVTWLVSGMLSRLGYVATAIGTLTGPRTTPAAPDLHRELRGAADRARAGGSPGAVALEVSSHALDQGRVDGLVFDVAVFTNLSHEHLDYHGTMESYFDAKASLFEPTRAHTAVVCIDDEWGRRLARRLEVPSLAVDSTTATDVRAEIGRTSFVWRGHEVATRLTGRLNVTNAMLAVGAVSQLGVAEPEAIAALAGVDAVPGRLEAVAGPGPSVLVDYAHTPAALELLLTDVRSLRGDGRLIVVFGCGGDRDRAKRPLMGEVASRLADEVYVTSDNPRNEDQEAILDEVVAGARGPAAVMRVADRRRAIAEAIGHAAPRDVVVLAGKGHETTQEIGGTFTELDDRVVAAEALAVRGGGGC
jgi:UDP-N-acetylmuramoyl-L-alanyl-D-glutamate--2,6-diaminopimelate ligase